MTPPMIIILLVLGAIMLLAELYVPGGVIGIFGAAIMLAGITGIFIRYGFLCGIISLFATIVVSCAVFYLWLKIFPKTKMGKKFLPSDKHEGWSSINPNNSNLLDKQGICHTPLRPCGIAVIDGKKTDVISRGEFIDKNTRIHVVEVEGNRIVVEEI